MRKLCAVVLIFMLIGSGVAQAHQPVVLLDSDTTAAKGPLLTDGTVSYAIRASFTKSGQKKAFRAQFNAGDSLSVQYLVVDKQPENALRTSALPGLVITSPSGTSVSIKLNERVKFYEPFSKVNYLYLSRYSAVAKAGVYSFTITSKGKAEITVTVGDREVAGEILRGPKPTPTSTPTVSPTPTPTATPSASTTGYTMTQVRSNNTAKSCWAVIDGNVYNLTTWINSHPGGAGAIVSLCGTDATSAFNSQHGNQGKPAAKLESFRLGALTK